MPSNHLILCRPLLQPSVFPSIRVFSNESVLHIRWPKYWSFSFSISPSSEYSRLISFRTDWLDLLAVQGTLKSLQHHSSKALILQHSVFFPVQLSHPYMTTDKPKLWLDGPLTIVNNIVYLKVVSGVNLSLFLVSFLLIYLFGCTESYLRHTGSGIFSCSVRTLSCDMWDPVPCQGIEHRPPALGTGNPSHWTTREVLRVDLKSSHHKKKKCMRW